MDGEKKAWLPNTVSYAYTINHISRLQTFWYLWVASLSILYNIDVVWEHDDHDSEHGRCVLREGKLALASPDGEKGKDMVRLSSAKLS